MYLEVCCSSYKLISINVFNFKVVLSSFMGPYLLHYIIIFWIYPMKAYTGNFSCHLMVYLRNLGVMVVQLQSFFMATFRYICLHHQNFLLKYKISPSVSNKSLCKKPNLRSSWNPNLYQLMITSMALDITHCLDLDLYTYGRSHICWWVFLVELDWDNWFLLDKVNFYDFSKNWIGNSGGKSERN